MKTIRIVLATALLAAGLSGCGGGYPMTAASRTGVEKQELTIQDEIRIRRTYARSRASGK